MTVAMIKNEIVENLIVADDLSIAPLFPDFILVRVDTIDPQPQIGWGYVNGEFVAPITE